jgi:ATP-dependent helicase/nuclease subunit A
MSDLTTQQKNAVDGRGNLIVVAGAGTGKTQTLIARCLRLVAEERVPLERILLVTFTEAAAAEMRGRLRQELLALHATRPADEHLAKQLALLDTARISTLHSFCLQLVREHFYQLHLDPQFSVLDERQTAPLRRATLDEILERHYSNTRSASRAVQQLVRAAGQGSDKPIRELVMKLHDYAQSLPDPDRWLAAQEERFAKNEPDEWRALFVQAVRDWRDEWLPVLTDDFDDTIPALKLARAALSALPENLSIAQAGDALRAVLAADPAENWPHGSKGKVRDPIKGLFDDAEFLGALAASGNRDPLAEDWKWARGAMTALVGLVREFTAGFAAKKRELAGVDFADLEQLLLRLLREPGVAAAWRSRLAHILVDEYQDINAAQDAILKALSRDGEEANRFLVGDVKQSIYRFRRANPAIFQNYQAQWNGRLPLTENFRARESLVQFVNALCGSLMRVEAGGVAYEPLVFGTPAQRKELSARPGDKPSTELHLIAKPGEVEANGDEENAGEANGPPPPDLLAVEREGRLVARRLRELHESAAPIWDKEKNSFRAVKWSDMAILLRSPAGRAEAFAIEFNKAGVPLSAARGGFFASLEVQDLLNLLKLLDNPLQDIPLVAVLRSPLAGLSPDELARLRAGSDVRPFWALLRQAEGPRSKLESDDPALTARVRNFLTQFDQWRELARQASLSQCLEAALNQTQYETLLLADARGPERVANVRKLLDLARQFDPYQRQGLYRFLRFVQSQADEDLDLQPAPPMAEDAVRLLSMHRSKGLEFPVVVLAGLGTVFNEQDFGGAVLIHESLGLCPRIMPPDTEQRYPGLTHWLARRAERRELRGEELRLLYVALTRARDFLILVGTVNRKADDVRWPGGVESPIDTNLILKARTQLDWLFAWLPRGTAESDWQNDRKGANRFLKWNIHDGNDSVFADSPVVAAADDVMVRRDELLAADALPKLKARLDWSYPFGTATAEPAKTTVSLLRRRLRDETDDESRPLIRFNPPRNAVRRGGGLSAARIGSAHHVFLQFASLEKLDQAAAMKAEAERMRADGLLSAEEVAALDLTALADFWQSAAGKRILEQRNNVHREIPFTARFSPSDLAAVGLTLDTSADEFVVVQGVVDLAVILPDEIRVMDFKTDEVTTRELPDRAKTYEPQLKLYAQALHRIYRRPVTECSLHFLSGRVTVPIDL